MDISSASSNEEFLSFRNIENCLGFKPSPTRNYIFTAFNRRTKYRDILFEGAYPLHEATNFIEDFLKTYITLGNSNTAYYISVILDTKNIKKETDTLNLCVLEPSKIRAERIENVKKSIKKLYFTFDNIYNSYCQDDIKYNRKYRKTTTLREFLTSKQFYYAQKEIIEKLYNNSETIVNIAV